MMKKARILLLLFLCGAALFWGLHRTGEKPIRLGLVDTGVSTSAISAQRLAAGYNYVYSCEDTEDRIGHGTAIAGIIVGSESAELAGLAPEAVLVPLVYHTQNQNGTVQKGDADTVAQAIYDGIDRYACDIINISAGTTTNSPLLEQAVAYAEEKGVLIVSSAGNSNLISPELVYYPGGYDTVLCVGSVNADGTVSAFSQRNDTVDLLAFGGAQRVASVRGKTICVYGTSFATAYVAAAAARLLAEKPRLSPKQIRQILADTATASPENGPGILNFNAALHSVAPSWNISTQLPQ